jgi:hypothetical protein
MITWLLVGDPHGRAQDIAELRKLLDFSFETAVKEKCVGIRFLGDIGHTFSIVHVDVLTEWAQYCRRCNDAGLLIEFLVGNHDYAGQEGGNDLLRAFDWGALVFRDRLTPTAFNNAYYMPFHRDIKDFERQCRSIPAGSLLYCHQSFNGARFENGSYDPHGADTECVAHLSQVVSGHVHTRQAFANIWYPGSPRDLSFSDAGKDKRIYVVEACDNKLRVVKELQTPCARYHTIVSTSVPDLLAAIQQITPEPTGHYSLQARGTSTEIAAFWREDAVKNFKAGCRRVVDNMLTSRAAKEFLPDVPAGATTRERFHAYIGSRKWRTSPDRLTSSAEKLLASATAATL